MFNFNKNHITWTWHLLSGLQRHITRNCMFKVHVVYFFLKFGLNILIWKIFHVFSLFIRVREPWSISVGLTRRSTFGGFKITRARWKSRILDILFIFNYIKNYCQFVVVHKSEQLYYNNHSIYRFSFLFFRISSKSILSLYISET